MTSSPDPTTGALPLQPRPQTWFQRNWKWFVPLLVVVAVSFIAIFVGALLYGVESMFRASYPYELAVQRATASPAVAEAIGVPLHIGWFVSGSVNFSGAEGSASLSIPISGPKGRGRIMVVGKKHLNVWKFDVFEVDAQGKDEPIPLLEPAPALAPGNSNGNSI
jgi:hypothetical protein